MHHNNNYGRQSLSPAISQNITMQYSTFFPSWAAIVGLRNCVRPSAVIRCVILFVIAAINAQTRWRVSHIGKKVFKAVAPPRAHNNSSRSVPFVSVAVGVMAAIFHSLPYRVNPRPLHAMRGVAFNQNLAVPAPTGLIVTAFKVILVNLARCATFALAPHVKRFPVGRSQNCPAAKFSTKTISFKGVLHGWL